jgi:hypothetical protein
MGFIFGLIVFIVIIGRLDLRLPWPGPDFGKESR